MTTKKNKTAITYRVGATANGSVPGTEATAFSRWNIGIHDRFKEQIDDPEERDKPEAPISSSTGQQIVTEYSKMIASEDDVFNRYGLTETSPVMTLGDPDFFKFGTVGKPIPGVEVKIAEDGEIICRGHCVMQGYYKNEEATKEAIIDGWFHSGDIGVFDEDGLLRITDRKKSLIVTSGGKNVAPQPMEVSLTSNKYIEQCSVIGDDRNFISALIVPNKENLMAWAEEQGLASLDYKSLCDHDQTYEHFDAIVKNTMTNFSRYESVRKFTLIADEWTVDNGELTPKMSIKRKVVAEKHKEEINAMYDSKSLPKQATNEEGQLFG